MGRTSKAKGANFERVLVNDIRRVFRLTNTRDCFRTPLSGGHHAHRLSADITLSAVFQRRFPWVVEAKHWRGFRVGNFLSLTTRETACFDQVIATAERANNDAVVRGLQYRPLLVVKANFAEPYAAFPTQFITDAVWYDPHVYFSVRGHAWVALTWARFLVLVRDKKL